ncbi:hypothetical protein MF6394_13725 [Pseudomonas sp. MF6394]|uniref:Uncharacterized protein n=1 Tax=Pseudomonas fluorescens TaxID=294 RepID=A0A2T0HRS1_PSEFL|nr:hypothetical protein BFC21_04490 [Pseudomonas sp. TMW 2.1634]OOW02175.1 hypothetical protein MF6394_13725 [Pseudomonas sp. MF6394]PRW85784.1 hypothetical protein C7A10_26260 [Pseudomonas fluorescens]
MALRFPTEFFSSCFGQHDNNHRPLQEVLHSWQKLSAKVPHMAAITLPFRAMRAYYSQLFRGQMDMSKNLTLVTAQEPPPL